LYILLANNPYLSSIVISESVETKTAFFYLNINYYVCQPGNGTIVTR
jgi:hypothetical protein